MIRIGSLWVQEGECSMGDGCMVEKKNFGKMKFWRKGRESCWGEKIGWGKEEWG